MLLFGPLRRRSSQLSVLACLVLCLATWLGAVGVGAAAMAEFDQPGICWVRP
ncbi:MAG: hypothetical protein U0992_22495 [Planctomycetaceae bacterium]